MRFAPLRAFWGTSSNVATVALGGVRKGAERRPWKGLLRILSPGLLWFPMADRSQSERAAETSNARPSRVPRSLLLVLPCSLALMSCLSSSNNSHKRARCVCVSAASQVVAGILKGWRARRFACPLASYSGWLSRTRTRKASPGPLLPFFRHPPAGCSSGFSRWGNGTRNRQHRAKPGTEVGTRRGNRTGVEVNPERKWEREGGTGISGA